MITQPCISICIPTFRRAALLAELLDSILAQDHLDRVEVVVSDDASPDETAEVAEGYASKFQRFRFLRQPVNIGLDANFLAVTAAATGEFIWLMGDDDRLEPGGLARVLAALDADPDLLGLTVGVVDYDVTMTQRVGVRRMPPAGAVRGAADLFGRNAELLGFMSAMVIRRSAWAREAANPMVRQTDNLYVQVLILGLAMGTDGRWAFLPEPCVGFRTGNDQFKRRLGWIDRLRMDAHAYDQIADALFSADRRVHRAMRRRVFNNHILARVINAKTQLSGERGSWRAAGFLVRRYPTHARCWGVAVPLLMMPGSVVTTLRRLYRDHWPASGTNRAKRVIRVLCMG